jgi:hypothetical protein
MWTFLTELCISGGRALKVRVLRNISALTKLKILKLNLRNIKSLPFQMEYTLIQLQELKLWKCKKLKYLPSTFTCCDAFPALTKFEIFYCRSLVNFPEVQEGALPKLEKLYFTGCWNFKTLPFSLKNLTSLRKLIVADCEEIVKYSCRRNCDHSSKWRAFNIQYEV